MQRPKIPKAINWTWTLVFVFFVCSFRFGFSCCRCVSERSTEKYYKQKNKKQNVNAKVKNLFAKKTATHPTTMQKFENLKKRILHLSNIVACCLLDVECWMLLLHCSQQRQWPPAATIDTHT